MKTINYVLILVLFLMVISCDNKTHYNTLVKINTDGTCYREFTESADSSFMVGDTTHNRFPVVIDSTWKVSWTYSPESAIRKYNANWPLKQWVWDKDTSKHLSLEVKVRKDYRSVEAMSKTFKYDRLQWSGIKPKIKLEKKFRWFFTFYRYSETYPKYNKLNRVPVDSFLTKDDIRMFMGDNPKFSKELNGREIRDLLNEIDTKSNLWLNQNFFEEYYRIIQKDLHLIKGLEIDSARFALYKDSVLKSMKDPFEREPRKFLQVLDNYYKVKSFNALPDTSKPFHELKMFEENILLPFTANLNYNLIIPGKIIDGGPRPAKGDTAVWYVDAYRFYLSDYTIYAESRVTNMWAFIISGIFIVGVVLSFFIKRKS
jgi:hypothetical protein